MRKESNVARNFAGRVGAIAGAGVIAATMWVGLGGSMGAAPLAPLAPEAITCLPTCDIDGRHLVVAGNDNTTLGAQEIQFGLSFTEASGEGDGNFALFDGDNDSANWDVPFNDGDPNTTDPDGPQLIIELWADPNGTGADTPGSVLLTTWSPAGTPFPTVNNGWSGVSFLHSTDALDDGLADGIGSYVYAIRVTPFQPDQDKGWNAFKVRAAGTVALLSDQPVGFIASMNPFSTDLDTIFPNFPLLTDSPYNGVWSFKTRLPGNLDEVTVFDGDMDFGNANCDYKDTDDPDTVDIPGFANPAAVAEGVATGGDECPGGGSQATGQPGDDNGSSAFRRVPTALTGVPAGIAYQIVAPDGQVFLNQNPSGNKEWEQFRIQKVDNASEIPGGILCPDGGFAEGLDGYAASDCRTTTLPGGVWDVQLDGMDMQNLNFWFFSFKIEPVEPPCEGSECPGDGIVAPTNQTCFDYASGEIETEYTMFYTQKQNPPKIGNVAPGVIFFFTKLTIEETDTQPLSVQQSIVGGTPPLKLHNNDARVFTANCTRVPATVSQDGTTGEVTFGTLAPGTYILQLKYQPKSLVGAAVPNPTPGEYTFTAALDGVPVLGTQNPEPLLLKKK